MPRIPYVDPASVTDPEIAAHNPAVIRAFSQAWDLTFRHGVTLGIGHGEVLGGTIAGLAPTAAQEVQDRAR